MYSHRKYLVAISVAVLAALVAFDPTKALAIPAIACVGVAYLSSRKFHLAANVGEGQSLHGIKTFIADTTGTLRYLIAKVGTVAGNANIAGAGDKPLGIFTDQPQAGLPTAVALLGAASGTQKVSVNSAVNNDDYLVTDANGYAKTLPTADGSYWVIGRAVLLSAAAAGDTIEFIPNHPFKVQYATGVATVRTA